jgi:hypothetical protein
VNCVPEEDAEPYHPTFRDIRDAEDVIARLKVEFCADVEPFGLAMTYLTHQSRWLGVTDAPE